MSMTKRYLDSLPADEQDAILGPPGSWMDAEYETVPQIFCKPDEWDGDAENEPTEEELAEWARALMEEDEPNDDFYRGEGDLEC